MSNFLINFFHLFRESAPFLLLGLLLAGVIKLLIPDKWIQRLLGKNSSVAVAALIGTPLPLCSCSVIPTAIAIRRSGASKSSTASFMVATPETGVDSIGITLALMGPIMAIARPFSAIISAIVAGTLVKWWDQETEDEITLPIEPETTASCCHKQSNTKATGAFNTCKKVFQYGYGKLLSDFMNWLLIGLFFAALIQTFVPSTILSNYGDGIFAMILIILISIPMYICATASTPIAVGLMLSGISPGAALVFMLAGPATNIATLMVIKNELGIRSLWAYLSGVMFTAMVMGLGLNFLLEYFELTITITQGGHGAMTSWIYQLSAIILGGLILWQYMKKIASAC